MPFISTQRECARRCKEHTCQPDCGKIFANARELVKHLKKSMKHREIEGPGVYTCAICQTDFDSTIKYIHHLKQQSIHTYDLHQAACCGNFKDVAFLIISENANKTGASHTIEFDELVYQIGHTPMHCAAFKGYSKCLRIMLSWPDGDPNIADIDDGQTPVHIAARFGRASSLKLLLNKGGSLDIKDGQGFTPINLAKEQCMDIILEYQIDKMIRKCIRVHISATEPANNRQDYEDVSGNRTSNPKSVVRPGVRRALSMEHAIEEMATRLIAKAADDNSVTDPSTGESSTSDIGQISVKCQNYLSEESSSTIQEDTLTDEICQQSLPEERSNTIQEVTETSTGESSTCNAGQISVLHPDSSNAIQEVPSELLPYEIIARGDEAVAAFKTALSEGKSSAYRLRLCVVGDVGAGKTSLTRSLSGLPFKEEREETHGIQTSMVSEPMVNNTELNFTWSVAEPDESHFDELVSKMVAEDVAQAQSSCSSPALENEASKSQVVEYQGSLPPDSELSSTMVAAEPRISVEGTPRKLPATRIAKKLLSMKKKKIFAEPNSVKVNIWDFAGHQLYETMHHVFMNSRSLYLVVFSLVKMEQETDKCLAKIHYWLNSIASHTSSNTPIIIVGTHRDLVDDTISSSANKRCEENFANAFNPRLIRTSRGKIMFPVANSLGQEDKGITHLIEMIKEEASRKLPFVTEQFPLKWLHCEEEIVSYQNDPEMRKYMHIDKVKEFLESRCNVAFTDEEFRSMLEFFHDNGLILMPSRDATCDEIQPSIRDLVVLSPQFLVDVMTAVHDVRHEHRFDRQYSEEFKKLKNEGRADSRLLEHIWQEHNECNVMVDLLGYFKLLHPFNNQVEADMQSECSPPEGKDRSEFIIPCMLKKKTTSKIDKKWLKYCGEWKDSSERDNILVFDFGRFLPPPLFDYFMVSIHRSSAKSQGIRPYVSKSAAIFSFSNEFLFRIQLKIQHSQIWVFARVKNGQMFIVLANKLVKLMKQICRQYFKFLKFIHGPPCPLSECPGAEFHPEEIQRPCESSSSGESGDEAQGAEALSVETIRRKHIIAMNIETFNPPYWCNKQQIGVDALEDWNPTITDDQALCESFDDNPDSPKEPCIEDCCLDFVAEELGQDWRKVGRKLISESNIENIDSDVDKQKEKCYQVLLKWKKSQGSEATVEKLCDVLCESGRKDTRDEFIKKHLKDKH